MSGAKLMSAIGNIADRYVMEFSDVTPKKHFKIQKYLPYIAACLGFVVCIMSVLPMITDQWLNEKPIIDNQGNNITSNEGSDSDAPIHFYLNGKTFIADPSMKIVTEVPDGYYYVGTVANVGDAFSGKDFEGNMSGAVYLSKDGKSAYVQSSSLEKINDKSPFILCVIEK